MSDTNVRLGDGATPDPQAVREPVPRVTVADLSEPGFYFVDFGPGVPVSILQVVPCFTQPATQARATPELLVSGRWPIAAYLAAVNPRRVKRINPGVDAFAPDRPAFTMRVTRGGAFVLGARVTVWQGDPTALALVEMQANGNPGDLRVWLDSGEWDAQGKRQGERLPATPADAYFAGVNPVCPICGGAHFAAECPSPTGRLPNARPEQPGGPVERPAPPTGTPQTGGNRAAVPKPLPPGVRRTGDPADARGDEFDPG